MSALAVLTRMPGRWLVPLLLLGLVLCLALVNYVVHIRGVTERVAKQESRILRERLSVEQTRLDVQTGAGNALLVRRLIGGLALHSGLDHAYLITAQGRVEASLSRLDIGRNFDELQGPWTATLGRLLQQVQAQGSPQITTVSIPNASRLVAFTPIQDGRWLVTSVNMSVPVAEQMALAGREVLRGSLMALAVAALLAGMLQWLWFHRARHLSQTLDAIGRGRTGARSRLEGRDELAEIGAEVNRMAERLEVDQAEIRHLHAVVNRSPVVVIEWRNAPGWPVVYVNDAVSQWGYAKADVLNGHWDYSQRIHPDDIERVRAEVAGYLAHGPDEYGQEYRLRCADGRWVWVDDRTTLTRDPSGTVVGISGILVDITAQKEAQQAVLDQTELLRMFYEMPFIGMAIASPGSRRWLQVNDRLCEILGYSREQLLQKTWMEMTPEPDLQADLDLFQSVVEGRRTSYQMVKRFVRQDGTRVDTDMHARAVRHADGSLRHFLITVQDISERVQAETVLREHKELLEQAEAMAGLGSWSFDAEGQRSWWSEQMFRNVGLDPATGLPSLDVYLERLHPDDRARVRDFMQAMAQGRDVAAADFRTCPDHGPVRWLRGTVERHTRPGGRPPYYTGTLLDITPVKTAEEALRHTNDALERRVAERTLQLSEANKELEAFSYTVSHDLRAPLRGIDGYSQLLQEAYGNHLDEDGRMFVQRIRRGVDQMRQLIADLLAYSRLERRTMGHETVELEQLVERVLEGFSADTERCGTAVDLHIEPMTLELDRDGLSLALRNLIGNAIKFSSAAERPLVQVGARSEDGRKTLWVRDNGVGFDMRYHDRIFGIFQRLHRAEDYSGTGVGLALVSKAVQRMGGRVWAESAPGAGATFYMAFPA